MSKKNKYKEIIVTLIVAFVLLFLLGRFLFGTIARSESGYALIHGGLPKIVQVNEDGTIYLRNQIPDTREYFWSRALVDKYEITVGQVTSGTAIVFFKDPQSLAFYRIRTTPKALVAKVRFVENIPVINTLMVK